MFHTPHLSAPAIALVFLGLANLAAPPTAVAQTVDAERALLNQVIASRSIGIATPRSVAQGDRAGTSESEAERALLAHSVSDILSASRLANTSSWSRTDPCLLDGARALLTECSS